MWSSCKWDKPRWRDECCAKRQWQSMVGRKAPWGCQLPRSFVLLGFGLAYASLTGLKGENLLIAWSLCPPWQRHWAAFSTHTDMVLIAHFLRVSLEAHTFSPVWTSASWGWMRRQISFTVSILLLVLLSGAAESFKVLNESVNEAISHIWVPWMHWDCCIRNVQHPETPSSAVMWEKKTRCKVPS